MFSLIITIIAIALVAALALATLYYGGTAFNEGSARAEAAKLMSQGQQLMGAADLYKADFGVWPASMADLVSDNYLTDVPVARADVLSPAIAAQNPWTMVQPLHPVFLVTPTPIEVCKALNHMAFGSDGVPKLARAVWGTQCYGGDAAALKVVTAKFGGELVAVLPADVGPDTLPDCVDATNAGWLVAPTVCGVVPEVPAVPAGVASLSVSRATVMFVDTTLWDTSPLSLPLVLSNTGDAEATLTSFTSANAGAFPAGLGACVGGLAAGATCELSIEFSPQVLGVASTTVTLSSSVGAITVSVSGTGVVLAGGAGRLDISRTPVAFADTVVAATRSLLTPLTVTNVGGASVSLTSFVASNPAVFPSGLGACGASLDVGASCDLSVQFRPAAEGLQLSAAVLTAADGTHSVEVRGVGVLTLPVTGALNVNPSFVTFSVTTVGGSSSSAVPVVLTNTGGASVALTSFVPTDAVNFSAGLGSCGATLAVGASCELYAQFNPTSSGAKATVAVLTSAAGAVTVVFQGTATTLTPGGADSGAVGGLTVNYLTVTFADTVIPNTTQAPVQVVLTNTGATDVLVNNTSMNIGEHFWGNRGTCDVLAPGQSCFPYLEFAPRAEGFLADAVVIDTDAGFLSIAMSGTGVNPDVVLPPVVVGGALTVSYSSITFGATLVNSWMPAVPQPVITNTGGADVTFTGPMTTTLPAYQDVYEDTCTGVLAPGASCSPSLEFGPWSAGSHDDIATLPSSAGDVTIALHGTARAQFLSPITVTYNGSAVGKVVYQGASGFLTDYDAGTLNLGPQTFGAGVTQEYTFLITNTGSDTLSYSGAVQGALQGNGTAATMPARPTHCSIVQPGATCTVDFHLYQNIALYGVDFAFISQAHPDAPIVLVHVDISASATGTAALRYSDDSGGHGGWDVPVALWDFGAVGVSRTSIAYIRITNIGEAVVEVTRTTLPAGWILDGGDDCADSALAPGDGCTVNVLFAPDTLAAFSGNLGVSLAGGRSANTLPLTGTGVEVQYVQYYDADTALDFAGNVIALPATLVGQQASLSGNTRWVGVRNVSGAPLTFANNAPSVTAPFLVTESGPFQICSGATFADNAVCYVYVDFSPLAVQVFNGTLRLQADFGPLNGIAVTGTGEPLPVASVQISYNGTVVTGPVDLGTVPPGTPVWIRVTNDGTDSLNVLNLQGYADPHGCLVGFLPGASCVLQFTPLGYVGPNTNDPYSLDFEAVYNGLVPTTTTVGYVVPTPAVEFNFNGVIIPDGGSVDFGALVPDTTTDIGLSVVNSGGTSLGTSDWDFIGQFGFPITMAPGTAIPASVWVDASGGPRLFQAFFDVPGVKGGYPLMVELTATWTSVPAITAAATPVQVTYNDALVGRVWFSNTGGGGGSSGYDQGTLNLGALDFSSGTSPEITFVVTNLGTDTIAYGGALQGARQGNGTVATMPAHPSHCGGVIAPGATCTVDFHLEAGLPLYGVDFGFANSATNAPIANVHVDLTASAVVPITVALRTSGFGFVSTADGFGLGGASEGNPDAFNVPTDIAVNWLPAFRGQGESPTSTWEFYTHLFYMRPMRVISTSGALTLTSVTYQFAGEPAAAMGGPDSWFCSGRSCGLTPDVMARIGTGTPPGLTIVVTYQVDGGPEQTLTRVYSIVPAFPWY